MIPFPRFHSKVASFPTRSPTAVLQYLRYQSMLSITYSSHSSSHFFQDSRHTGIRCESFIMSSMCHCSICDFRDNLWVECFPFIFYVREQGRGGGDLKEEVCKQEVEKSDMSRFHRKQALPDRVNNLYPSRDGEKKGRRGKLKRANEKGCKIERYFLPPLYVSMALSHRSDLADVYSIKVYSM